MQRSMTAMQRLWDSGDRPEATTTLCATAGAAWGPPGPPTPLPLPLCCRPPGPQRRAPCSPALTWHCCCPLQGGYKYHQYQVVGRHVPTEKDSDPTIYRMKLWAQDAVRAKSKFW